MPALGEPPASRIDPCSGFVATRGQRPVEVFSSDIDQVTIPLGAWPQALLHERDTFVGLPFAFLLTYSTGLFIGNVPI